MKKILLFLLALFCLTGCGLTTRDFTEVGAGLAVDTVSVDIIGGAL